MIELVEGLIVEELEFLRGLLFEKNRRYGNAALEPLNVFSRLGAEEGLRVRLDDKLRRVREAVPGDDEDAVLDLLGYLVLLRVSRRLSSV